MLCRIANNIVMLCYNFGRTIRKTFSLWMEWIYVFSFLTNPIYNILTTKKWNVYLVRRDKGWQLTVCFGRPHLVIIHVHNVLELERKLGRPSASALSGHGGGEAARKCALLLLNLINTIKWEKVLLWHSAHLTFPCMPPRDNILLTWCRGRQCWGWAWWWCVLLVMGVFIK